MGAVALAALAGCGGGEGEKIALEEVPGDVDIGKRAVWITGEYTGPIYRLDPESEEVEGVELTSPVEPVPDVAENTGEGAFWALRTVTTPEGEDRSRLDRIDEETGKITTVVAELPNSADLAVGEGSVWVAGDSGLLRIDPESGEVVAAILTGANPYPYIPGISPAQIQRAVDVPLEEVIDRVPSVDGANDVAIGEGAVWFSGSSITSEPNVVVAVDPEKNVVREEAEIGDDSFFGQASLAVGEGAVWAVQDHSEVNVEGEKPGLLTRIDPESGQVTDEIELGEGALTMAVGEGSVWVADDRTEVVFRIDPSSAKVREEIEAGPAPGGLAVGFGSVWVATGELKGTGEESPDGGEVLEPADAGIIRLEP